MSASAPGSTTSLSPAFARLALGAALLCALAACKQEQPAATDQAATPAASQPVAPPAAAVSAEVAALSAEQLREKARAAYAQSKLYAPAGDNAMEYYLALRDKQPGDAGVSSALTDLMPMAVIATEQSRDREDFVEAQRLYALIEKADPQHPALARLKTTIADAQAALAKRAEQEKLTTEQEAQRQAQLEEEREKQQQAQQQQAAQQLAAQQAAEQQAATQREADQRAAAQREAEERAAAARTPQQPAAQPTQVAQGPAATATTAAAAPASAALRPLSTPAPRYPPEALRAGQSGEVQVEFTVNADGSVANARVVRANPPRVFDREAVAAVRRWRFEPVGEPVTTRRTIGFKPGD